MRNKQLWYNLIKHYKKNNKITFGLTIPFIVGVYKINSNNETSINHLLNQIIESNYSKCAVLQKCPNLNHYVIGIEDRNFARIYMKNYIQIKDKNQETQIYITLNAKELGNDINMIVKKLESLYFKEIESNKFSWNKKEKKWSEFDKTELLIIRKMKNEEK